MNEIKAFDIEKFEADLEICVFLRRIELELKAIGF